MIYFLTPDESRPSGGTRQIYLMVDLLCDLGYDAAVFHGNPGFRCTWFANETPIVARSTLRLDTGDVLVVPEYSGGRGNERCGDARVVVFNQNHFRTFNNLGYESGGSAYPGWPNAKAALYTTETIREFLSIAVQGRLPLFRTRVVVDVDRFVPRPKRRLIALMRRKRHAEGEAVVQLARRSGVTDWEFAAIDQLEQDRVAALLGEAAIFLSFSSEEGFGLPPAEAMAAGCYVVGYTGDGGREFMKPEWCSPIADQDLVAFAKEVVRITQQFEHDPAALRTQTTAARENITATYTRAQLRIDLADAFSVLTDAESEARQPAPASVTHWSVPVGPRGTLVRARRRVAASLRRRP